VSLREGNDEIYLNGDRLPEASAFHLRLTEFLHPFRPDADAGFRVETHNNIPTGAGLASSASGFAALVRALDQLMGWSLDARTLSILARMGSGSACRSLFHGFAEWHAGKREDGMDSYAEPLAETWPTLRIATLTVSNEAKPVGSTEGMNRTRDTSVLYRAWPDKVAADLQALRTAIHTQDFELLGRAAESNAMSLHATMLGAWPPLCYWRPESLAAMHKVWELRAAGVPLYFTMDAGPNLKLLFLEEDEAMVRGHIPGAEVIAPFEHGEAHPS
jgi:diphosphomevalonate decarboxylase